MSLATPIPPKTFRLGIVAAKNLDDPSFLDELVGENTPVVSHVYTNGANPLVFAFAADHGIPLSVFPLTGGRSLPWSTSRIIENSDFVFVVGTSSSKSAGQVVTACVAAGVKHRLVQYDPCTHWREKVVKAAALLAVMTPEDVERGGAWVAAIKESL